MTCEPTPAEDVKSFHLLLLGGKNGKNTEFSALFGQLEKIQIKCDLDEHET